MSEITELAEKLRSEGERFVSIFSGLNDDRWSQEVYTEGTTWTIRNILAHFVTSERARLLRGAYGRTARQLAEPLLCDNLS